MCFSSFSNSSDVNKYLLQTWTNKTKREKQSLQKAIALYNQKLACSGEQVTREEAFEESTGTTTDCTCMCVSKQVHL